MEPKCQTADIEVGDVVRYKSGLSTRVVRVDNFGWKDGRETFDGEVLEIKNKQPVDGTEVGDLVWGYVTQVE